jgi:hypothetical protein
MSERTPEIGDKVVKKGRTSIADVVHVLPHGTVTIGVRYRRRQHSAVAYYAPDELDVIDD